MAQQTVNGRYPVEGVIDMLKAALAGDPLDGAHLRLYKSSFAPLADSTQADFEAAECDFTGYAPAAITWSAVGIDAAGNPIALSDRAFFQATDAVAPNTVGGCWIQKDVTGPPAVHTAIEWFPFNPTVPLLTALAFVGVVIGVQMPGTPGFAIVDN